MKQTNPGQIPPKQLLKPLLGLMTALFLMGTGCGKSEPAVPKRSTSEGRPSATRQLSGSEIASLFGSGSASEKNGTAASTPAPAQPSATAGTSHPTQASSVTQPPASAPHRTTAPRATTGSAATESTATENAAGDYQQYGETSVEELLAYLRGATWVCMNLDEDLCTYSLVFEPDQVLIATFWQAETGDPDFDNFMGDDWRLLSESRQQYEILDETGAIAIVNNNGTSRLRLVPLNDNQFNMLGNDEAWADWGETFIRYPQR